MDNEMIERCAEAAHDRSYAFDMISDFALPMSDAKAIAIAVIKAMREPTQAQYDALCATNKVWRELDSLTVWQTYIDAVIGE